LDWIGLEWIDIGSSSFYDYWVWFGLVWFGLPCPEEPGEPERSLKEVWRFYETSLPSGGIYILLYNYYIYYVTTYIYI